MDSFDEKDEFELKTCDCEDYDNCIHFEEIDLTSGCDDENVYNVCVKLEDHLTMESRTEPLQWKEVQEAEIEETEEDRQIEDRSSEYQSLTVSLQYVNEPLYECSSCKILVCERNSEEHKRSNVHKNSKKVSSNTLPNVSVAEYLLGNKTTYRIAPYSVVDIAKAKIFLDSIKLLIITLLECNKIDYYKVNFVLHTEFVKKISDLKSTFDFKICHYNFNRDTNDLFTHLNESVEDKIKSMSFSDWMISSIISIDLNVYEIEPDSRFIRNDSCYKKVIQNQLTMVCIGEF